MKILVAEDDPITALLIDRTLSSWGYQTQVVNNGLDALKALNSDNAPQMAILDWVMPNMTGTEVCKALRQKQEPEKKYTYILLLTCKDNVNDIIEGLNTGADDYITKPFNTEELRVRLICGQRILSQEQELFEALGSLKKSENLRDRFIAALSHDLRTPLNAQRMALEVLAQKSKNYDKAFQELIESIVHSNSGILNMVNQILQDYHLEQSGQTMRLSEVDLYELASQCVLTLQPLALQNQITLRNLIQPKDLPKLQGGSEHIHRVLINLVGNALQNIPPHCQIEILGFLKDGAVHVQVRDNGNGLPPGLLPNLFERYPTSTEGRLPKIGTGLGLSICKEIITRHGGTITVDSTPEHGCTFTFTLPLTQPMPTHRAELAQNTSLETT